MSVQFHYCQSNSPERRITNYSTFTFTCYAINCVSMVSTGRETLSWQLLSDYSFSDSSEVPGPKGPGDPVGDILRKPVDPVVGDPVRQDNDKM